MPTDPPHLRQLLDEHTQGETVRLALPLGALDPATVSAVDFAMEQEGVVAPTRVTASLTGAVVAGQSGVQKIAATAVDPQPTPPLDPAATVYEVILETATLPSGWWKFEAALSWPFGRRVVAAGRLHLRDSAFS
jgi:hypothetical protein